MPLHLRLVVCAALLAPSSARASEDLFRFGGFDFRVDPSAASAPDPANYLAPGDGLEVLGRITGFGPYLEQWTDSGIEAYTVRLAGLRAAARWFEGDILWVAFHSGAGIELFADSLASGVPSDFGVHPPNTTAPSTFTDGDGSGWLQLRGTLEWARLRYDFARSTAEVSGCVTLTDGPYLSYVPASWREDWSLIIDFDPNALRPAGYDHGVRGQLGLVPHGCDAPVPAARSSWGAIKSIYR